MCFSFVFASFRFSKKTRFFGRRPSEIRSNPSSVLRETAHESTDKKCHVVRCYFFFHFCVLGHFTDTFFFHFRVLGHFTDTIFIFSIGFFPQTATVSSRAGGKHWYILCRRVSCGTHARAGA